MGKALFTWRSVAVQVLLVSITSFCTIGSFDALQGLGGAGQGSPYVANAATAINFGLMGLVCLFGGPIVNLLGPKWCLAIGTCGDPLFGAAIYCNTRWGTEWFLIVASILRGTCSGLFWAAEGAVIIGYPRAQHRGKSITTWAAFKELGSVISSAINLGISAHDDKAGHVQWAVYYVTISIMCAGLPFALMVSPTRKAHHRNGDPVVLRNSGTYKEEYKHLLRLFLRRDVQLIMPFAWFAYFYYSFSHTFVVQRFSVRARALTSLLCALSSILGSAIVAVFSDRSRPRSRRQLITLTILVICLVTGGWIYFAYVALNDVPKVKLDWLDPGYARLAMAVIIIFMVMQSAQTYLYWTAAHLADDVRDSFHLAGAVRGIESLGQCVAYSVNSTHKNYSVSIGLNLAFFVVGMISLLALLWRQEKQKATVVDMSGSLEQEHSQVSLEREKVGA